MLYLADVAEGVKAVSIIICVLIGLVCGAIALFSFLDGKTPSYRFLSTKKAIFTLSVLFFLSLFVPTSRTVLLIASSEVAETVAISEDGKSVLKSLQQVLIKKLNDLKDN